MTWTKAQIRAARKKELAPILNARAMHLKPLSGGNFLVVEYDDLVVKRCYWRWPSRGLDGNAIDFFMLVERKSFNQAMEILTDRKMPRKKQSKLPSYAKSQKH